MIFIVGVGKKKPEKPLDSDKGVKELRGSGMDEKAPEESIRFRMLFLIIVLVLIPATFRGLI